MAEIGEEERTEVAEPFELPQEVPAPAAPEMPVKEPAREPVHA